MRENKAKQAVEPLKSNAPLPGSSKARLVATVQKQRLVCKELEGRIAELEKEIETNSIPIDEIMEKDISAKRYLGGEEVTPPPPPPPHETFLGATKKTASNAKMWKKVLPSHYSFLPVCSCQVFCSS